MQIYLPGRGATNVKLGICLVIKFQILLSFNTGVQVTACIKWKYLQNSGGMKKSAKKKNAIKLMLFKPLTLSTTLVLVLISKMGIYIINS